MAGSAGRPGPPCPGTLPSMRRACDDRTGAPGASDPMSKFALLKFLAQPGEVVRGLQRLGPRGAVTHGLRRASAMTERALLGPAQMRINPMGAVCNHTCPMCWLQQMSDVEKKAVFKADRANGLTLAEYERLLASVPPGLTEVNVVGGGEPLVHPDARGILAAIKRRKVRGYLISNGSLLDEDLARAMIAMHWDLVRVSTHAGDPDTYELVQGVRHFDRVLQNLATYDRLRREAGRARTCKLHVHHVIQRENLETIPAMFEFGVRTGADHVVFERVFALSPEIRLTRSELARAEQLLAEGAAAARVSSNAVEIAAQLRAEQADAPEEPLAAPQEAGPASPPGPAPEAVAEDVAAPSVPLVQAEPTEPSSPAPAEVVIPPPAEPFRPANRCSVGFDSTFIHSNGDVLPCCFSNEVLGNVREQPFSEIWFGEKYRDFRKRLIRGEFADYCSNVRCNLRTFLHD